MTIINKQLCAVLGMLLLASCGGGGDRAAGVEPGPTAPGGVVVVPAPSQPDPNRPAVAYAEAETLFATITSANIDSAGAVQVDFQVVDANNTAITDLAASNVRFIVAKLRASELGNLTGTWQSYINRIEAPGVGPGLVPKLQATTESNGTLTNHGDGTYHYLFATNVLALSADVVAQAQAEGLDLSFEPVRTHRIAMQFSGAQTALNPVFDWQPSTGATASIFHKQVVDTANCNRCHNKLALHGGGRVEMEYCVTCHNPGSSDANSGNSVAFDVMIHKIHRGRNLPSVVAGGSYSIYGFRNRLHDYSALGYPQDIRNCANCHAGTATDNGKVQLTAQGDNWSEYASRAVCGSCHDDLDFAVHQGGQSDDSGCISCHAVGGSAGSIADSHRDRISETSAQLFAEILGVSNSGPGQQPIINFKVTNLADNSAYDIKNDSAWVNGRLALRLSWQTQDYTNTGNGANNASSLSVSVSSATDNGDGSFSVTSGSAIPDGSVAPFIAATGSGTAVLEGRAAIDVDADGGTESVPLINVHKHFSIDEVDATAKARRQVVELDRCLACHQSLVLHGANRSNNLSSCVTCHNPRNTDRSVRAIAANPPTDGKTEESIDFKTMIHAIHAAGMRENPLQIVGFRGFSTHRYDTQAVHYPGELQDCKACHAEGGYELPLAAGVLGTSVDTGTDLQSPTDDLVVSPMAAVCSSCHDSDLAAAHMQTNGASFSTPQSAIDAGSVLEQCVLCHGAGRVADVDKVH